MKLFLSTLLCLCITTFTIGQTKIQQLTQQEFAKGAEKINPFSRTKSSAKTGKVDPAVLETFQLLDLNTKTVQNLLSQKTQNLELILPVADGVSYELELIPSGYDPNEFKVYAASEREKYLKLAQGKHYWGQVKGDPNSMVALSFYDGEITGSINTSDLKYSISKLKGQKEHILYQEKDLKEKPSFSCFSDELEALVPSGKMNNAKAFNPDNAVRMYIEVDNDIYQDFGTVQATANYINAALNQVAILYANESINFLVNEMVIWDTADPYTGPSTSNYLNQFQSRLGGAFNGDLAHLIGNQGSGGIAYVNGLCRNKNFALGYSGIRNSFNNVPAYSWTINVLTHEVGHNLGSPHTHSCSWNGNNTAIDGCGPAAGANEGCNAPIPQEGGTIMSYCHLTNVGVDFNLGFGQQPGDLIRDIVYNADCLTPAVNTCGDGIQNGNETGVDCGGSCPACPPSCTDGIRNGNETGIDCGGDCAPCPDVCAGKTAVLLNIKLDNYPEETSWVIRNEAGSVVLSGGTYGNQADGSTISIEDCLSDGCYTFTIRDTYGDGICCNYGQGNYQLTSGGEVVASGAAFGSSESTDFCVGSTVPTCSDGVQNGNETGVDCGGPDCQPCVTCEDGIQNGDETGVDCGGSDCAPCVTCNDGIQNGNETGVDCGGPDCQPCVTCEDGIQNGDETGVDCGGSDCAPCVTCNDGIQNGDETGVDCGGSDCQPCVTCEDGVQNGDEAGVDCGGTDCAPCVTCNDGIQNGNETGVDCGGPDCEPCTTGACTDVVITIRLDNYPEETSWTLRDSEGNLLGQGGTYGSQPDGSTVTASGCLDDGCYTFEIRDTYGDGICCTYGQGQYSILVDGNTVASGGAFGSSKTETFCIGDEPTPTCSDGMQNGDETGVDCGGSCEPCSNGDCTYTTIMDDDFEVANNDWIDGGSDCRRSSLDAPFASSGSYCYRLRDNTSSSVMTSKRFDLASADEVLIEFNYYARSMDNSNEGFILEVSTDDGNTFTVIDSWYRGTEFNNNQFMFASAVYDGLLSDQTRFRFRCDASSNADLVYIDDVMISACDNGPSSLPEAAEKPGELKDQFDPNAQFVIFPNPADTEVTVDFVIPDGRLTQLSFYDLNGREVYRQDAQQLGKGEYRFRVDVGNLNEGMYFAILHTSIGEYIEQFEKKFIILRE